MAIPDPTKALLLFSGGQDSGVCLAWALDRYDAVETVGFQYGQRHQAEMTARQRLRKELARAFPNWGARLGPDHVLDIAALGEISETSLTRETEIGTRADGLPTSFVPGRNLIFLSFAAALAANRGLGALIGGMCEADYSGYPDCRAETIAAMARALKLGLGAPLAIETPLMHLDKAASWALAHRLGGARLVALLIEETHSCYLDDRSARHPWGYGCGACPACALRAKGFEKFTSART
ncbi:MAG: 7-cyano-7-deazaguanine synthase QueC [Parvularculaceae bacterium]